MKPFKFKLQTSLDLEHHREEQQQKDLTEKIAIKNQQEMILQLYEQQMVNLFEEIRSNQQQRVNVEQLRMQSEYLPILEGQTRDQAQVVSKCEHAVVASREKLLEVVRDRKVLEKLKVKHYEEYKKEIAREEQKMLDEMATNAFLRKTQQWPQEG